MAKKTKLKEVNSTAEELEEVEEKIKKHKRKTARLFFLAVIIVLVFIAFVEIYFALSTYDSYETKEITEIGDKSASHFAEYNKNILEYSNDGIVCVDTGGDLIWNQAFEMTTPRVDACGEYVCAYDQGGKDIYIMNSLGMVKHIETSMLISTACMAGQGTVAVMMEENGNFYIKLFDKAGKELTNGEFFSEKGAIPVDIALSSDAQKLAVALIDITEGKINSQISFFNFGSVGQNEINNNVGTFTYENTLVVEVDYLGNNTMIAKCDNSVKIYEGSQKPVLSAEISVDQYVDSIVNSDKNIAILRKNQDEVGSHHIRIYSLSGNLAMEYDTELLYTDVKFLANNELLIKDKYNCEIYTVHNIRKFKYTFDVPLYSVFSETGKADYVFYKEGTMEEVRLK